MNGPERDAWLAAARDLRERAAVVKDVGGGHPTANAIVEALTDSAIAFETKANAPAVQRDPANVSLKLVTSRVEDVEHDIMIHAAQAITLPVTFGNAIDAAIYVAVTRFQRQRIPTDDDLTDLAKEVVYRLERG